jgi:hypothetical protein
MDKLAGKLPNVRKLHYCNSLAPLNPFGRAKRNLTGRAVHFQKDSNQYPSKYRNIGGEAVFEHFLVVFYSSFHYFPT